MITPEYLLDLESPQNIEEFQVLEAMIDDHVYKHYSHKGCKMPGIQIKEQREIIKSAIINQYASNSWIISFQKATKAGYEMIYIDEITVSE